MKKKKKAEGRKTLKQQRDTFLSGEGGEPGVCDTIPEGQLNFLAMQ